MLLDKNRCIPCDIPDMAETPTNTFKMVIFNHKEKNVILPADEDIAILTVDMSL